MGKVKDIIIDAEGKGLINIDDGLENIPTLEELVEAIKEYNKTAPPGSSVELDNGENK
jgi:hypothetical protein